MRITCPNCGAQYEVPEQVIPTEGRDVQCSSCGNTWFQAHPDQAMQPDDDADLIAPEVAETPEPEPEPQPEPVAEVEEEEIPQPRQRELDPEVKDILREEVEHETRQREAEMAAGLESQSELGLETHTDDEATRRAREARDRMARMRGEDPETEEDAEPDLTPRPRSRLLPDVEDVNTAIQTESPPAPIQTGAEMAVAEPVARRGGFGRGFGLVVLIGAVLLLLYVNADKIAEMIPALSGGIEAYVAQVDKLRFWLDGQLSAFIPQ